MIFDTQNLGGRVALVDGNNLAQTAYKVKGHLQNSRGVYTGTVLVAIDMLRTLLRTKPEIESVVLAWDSDTSWRKLYYPEYKANRIARKEKSTGPEYDWPAQKSALQHILPFFGVPQISKDLMEADDIAGMWMGLESNPITFVSNDIDWLQVLANPIHEIYRTLDKSFVTMKEFEERSKGCRNPAEMVGMYGLAGQSKDNIPGIPGVGPVKALSYIRGEMKAGKVKDKIVEWMSDPEGFARSYVLTAFGACPEEYTHGVVHDTPPQYNEQEIIRIFQDYEANARLARMDEFLAPFRKLQEIRQREQGAETPGED